MGKKVADLLIKIGADIYEFKTSTGDVKKQLNALGKDLQGFGKSMSMYFTAPITAAAGAAVHLADVQMQAEQRLLTALKGKENVQKRLIKQAGELQSRSTLGDEAIIGQQAFLASLGMTEQKIGKVIEASAQLSAATGMTLDGAVKNLAKTYGGLTGELGESIPALKQFTAEQLKNGAAVEYVMSNYKGYAETIAGTGLGPLLQLKNTLGDLGEEIGTILMPVVQKIVGWLQNFVTWLQSLSPATKTTIVVIGGLVAAIGPLSFGLGAVIKMLPLLTTGFTAMLGPIGWVATAIGVATAALWAYNTAADAAAKARVSQQAQSYINSGKSLEELQAERAKAIADNAKHSQNYNDASDRLNPLKSTSAPAFVSGWTDNRRTKMREEALVGITYEKIKALDEAIGILQTTANNTVLVSDPEPGAGKALGRIEALEKEISNLEAAKKKAFNSYEIANLNKDIEKLRVNLSDLQNTGKMPGIIGNKKGLVDGILSKHQYEGKGTQYDVRPLTGNIETLRFDPNAINPPREVWDAAGQNIVSDINNVYDYIEAGVIDIGTMLNSLFQDLALGIGTSLGNIFSGDGTLDDLLASFGKTLGNFLISLGKELIVTSKVVASIKASLGSLFKLPGLGIAIGIGAIAIGQAMVNAFSKKHEKGVALAQGGLAYGPTMALVGDNRGAGSDPEVIAPLSKLRQYGLGRQAIEFVGGKFELSGSNLLLAIRREDARITYTNALG